MSGNDIKLLSEIEDYELINITDGEKYEHLQDNDLVIDNNGNIKFLVINLGGNKFSFLNKNHEFLEIPWSCVKKIGSKTIILDADETNIRKTKL